MFSKKFSSQLINLAFLFMMLFSIGGCTSISKEVAGQRAQAYIGKYVIKNGIDTSVSDVKDENGFYSVSLQIKKGDQVVDKVKVFVTKDGKTLSLGPIFDLNKPPATPQEQQKAAAQDIPKKDIPDVDLFVMAGCPYGLQAEAAFAPVVKALGDKINFTPHYVIYSNYQGGGPNYCLDKESKYCSMHGAEEAREGVRQLCIWTEQKGKWWDYINKFNEKCSIDDKTPSCSKSVAGEVGIDYSKVEACLNKSGEKLLAAEVELNNKYKVEGSPTIVINGVVYNGSRSPNDLLTSICASYNQKPAECNTKLAGGDTAPAAKGGCGR